jgi:hypothetical protein
VHWYNYLAAFVSGAAFANFVPHFVHGVSGDGFPTPFARPPGRGLSSPTINVVWALVNLILGYVLWRAGGVTLQPSFALLVCFAGIAVLGIQASVGFQKKQKP